MAAEGDAASLAAMIDAIIADDGNRPWTTRDEQEWVALADARPLAEARREDTRAVVWRRAHGHGALRDATDAAAALGRVRDSGARHAARHACVAGLAAGIGGCGWRAGDGRKMSDRRP